jgi:translation elongation factor EF-Ts
VPDVVAKEREIAEAPPRGGQARGCLPEIIEGGQRFFKDVCLGEQPSVKDSKKASRRC